MEGAGGRTFGCFSSPQPPCLATSGCDAQNDISCSRFPTIQRVEARHSYEIDALTDKNEGFQLTNAEKSCEIATTLRLFQSHNLKSQDTPPKGEIVLVLIFNGSSAYFTEIIFDYYLFVIKNKNYPK